MTAASPITLECFDSSRNIDGHPYPEGTMCGEPITIERRPEWTRSWVNCPRCGCGWRASALRAWMGGAARKALAYMPLSPRGVRVPGEPGPGPPPGAV